MIVYFFESKQLQRFIFHTGKLREATGASELINSLCWIEGKELAGKAAEVSKVCGLAASVEKAAGGTVVLSASDDQLEKLKVFRTLWRLAVSKIAPGLAFADGIGCGEDVNEATGMAHDALAARGPQSMDAEPLASPLIRPAPRSGRSPAQYPDWTSGGRCVITKEFSDISCLAKRQAIKKSNDLLASRFAGVKQGEYKWPLTFQSDESNSDGPVFPFTSDNRSVALIHIDGNDIGKLFQQDGLSGDTRRAMSDALSRATISAANAAMQPVLAEALAHVVPARPVLLGGDDITLIVRADLAMNFVKQYVAAFQRETEGSAALGLQTAKAGIVFMGASQPFAQAYGLCEALSKVAKKSRESQVSFWRLTSSMIPRNKEDLISQSVSNGGGTHWRQAWNFDDICALENLIHVLEMPDVGRGAMRQVPEVLKTDLARAQALFDRARLSLGRRRSETLAKFDAAMRNLHVAEGSLADPEGYCPLLDAHQLMQVTRGRSL